MRVAAVGVRNGNSASEGLPIRDTEYGAAFPLEVVETAFVWGGAGFSGSGKPPVPET